MQGLSNDLRQFFLVKNNLLTSVHNNTDNVDNANEYNSVIGIALLKAFSCAKKEEMKDKYPWLDQNHERRNMSDKEILDKYADLEKSCLSDSEKKQFMDMLYKYKMDFV